MQYTWNCPFCDVQGEEDWHKRCCYALSKHLQEKHTDQMFEHIISQYQEVHKKAFIDQHWGLITPHIKQKEE